MEQISDCQSDILDQSKDDREFTVKFASFLKVIRGLSTFSE